MRRALTLLALLALVPAGRGPLHAESPKQVRVTLDFRRASTQSRDAAQGGGRVIVTERGAASPSGRVGVESTGRKVTQTTGIFTLVQDGGESTLLVASQVPYSQVTYYRDYLTGAGYLATGVAFKDVGTSLKVRAMVLPGNRVKVRVTPVLSWFADDRSGVVEVAEASTELIVPNGRPVVVGGSATTLHELTRQILGRAVSRGESDQLMTLTATVLE
jgi:hypothetical protein